MFQKTKIRKRETVYLPRNIEYFLFYLETLLNGSFLNQNVVHQYTSSEHISLA